MRERSLFECEGCKSKVKIIRISCLRSRKYQFCINCHDKLSMIYSELEVVNEAN